MFSLDSGEVAVFGVERMGMAFDAYYSIIAINLSYSTSNL